MVPLFERAVNFTISLYDNKNVDSPFFEKLRRKFLVIKVFLKISQNSQKAIYAGVFFSLSEVLVF